MDRLLLRLADAGVVAAILLVPLAMGGRTAVGQLLLVVLASAIAVCWCLRQAITSDAVWVRSPATWLILAVIALLGLQVAPQPASWLAALSPQIYAMLPLWSPPSDGTATLGLWQTLSLAPAETRGGFVMILAFGLLFLTVLQRVRRPEDVERLLKWISLATMIMAAFALVQFFCGNGKFFWFYEHPYTTTGGSVKGSFTNRNHFADFMALGIGPSVWWIYSTWQRVPVGGLAATFGRKRSAAGVRTALIGIGLAIIVFAGALSLSRGGTVAMVLAALASLALMHRVHRFNRSLLIAFSAVAALIAASLLIYGYQSVANRLQDFSSLDQLDRGNGRRKIWEADLRAMAEFPLTGTGVGSHVEVYPRYLREDESTQFQEYTHAENGYVQIGLEMGIPGLVLLGVLLVFCVWWCVPAFCASSGEIISLCFVGIVPSLLASAAHSVADFVWYVPGCMVAPVVLAGCACRLRQMAQLAQGEAMARSRITRTNPCAAAVSSAWEKAGGTPAPQERVSPRGSWLAIAVCLLVIGVVSAQNRLLALQAEPHWHHYLKIAMNSPPLEQISDAATLQSLEEELTAVVQHQPDHARAHLQLAAVHLRMFDCPGDPTAILMDVRQVRDAVSASHFESIEAMNQWLARAFGARRGHLDAAAWHARCALESCPLLGEAYLLLAELAFLQPGAPQKAACVQQALSLRPYDGTVLFAAGQEAVLAGDLTQAGKLWRASFRAGSSHQDRLIHALAEQMPATAMIDLLQPDVSGLARIVSYYREHSSKDNLSLALERYTAACEYEAGTSKPRKAVENWSQAAKTYLDLGRPREAIRCAREAVRCEPLGLDARLLLGSCLLASKQYAEAVSDLKWCVQQDPREPTAQHLLERAMDGQLRTPTTNAGASPLSTIEQAEKLGNPIAPR